MNPEFLCIRLQFLGGEWRWDVSYPQGADCKRGRADTAEHALALAKLALEMLADKGVYGAVHP